MCAGNLNPLLFGECKTQNRIETVKGDGKRAAWTNGLTCIFTPDLYLVTFYFFLIVVSILGVTLRLVYQAWRCLEGTRQHQPVTAKPLHVSSWGVQPLRGRYRTSATSAMRRSHKDSVADVLCPLGHHQDTRPDHPDLHALVPAHCLDYMDAHNSKLVIMCMTGCEWVKTVLFEVRILFPTCKASWFGLPYSCYNHVI